MKSQMAKIVGIFLAAFLCMGIAQSQPRQNSDAAKKKEKIERSYKKAYAKARKRTIKHRRDIQTDATRERMEAADKRAKAYNSQNDPGFIERYFKPKRPRKK